MINSWDPQIIWFLCIAFACIWSISNDPSLHLTHERLVFSQRIWIQTMLAFMTNGICMFGDVLHNSDIVKNWNNEVVWQSVNYNLSFLWAHRNEGRDWRQMVRLPLDCLADSSIFVKYIAMLFNLQTPLYTTLYYWFWSVAWWYFRFLDA